MAEEARGASRTSRSGNWGQKRRLEFIDFRLLWEGRINRSELVDFFGISVPQASLDLGSYMQVASNNLVYDRSEKVYRRSRTFKPALIPADAQGLLNELLALRAGTLPPSLSFVGWRPPCEVVQYPTRSIDPSVLIRVFWAIRDREALEVTYQSMREPASTRRWIAPHSIAFDGSRWHVRAWCHESEVFRDFVFARIQRTYGSRPATIDPASDASWHAVAKVILRARSGLTRPQQQAIEAEFGMRSGELVIELREALVFYFVRLLHLHEPTESSIAAQPLEWVNRDDFKRLMEAARK